MSYQADNMAFNDAMDSLSHHGVLGMKWGVRNEETRRKYAGAKAYRRKVELATKADHILRLRDREDASIDTDREEVKRIADDPKVKTAYDAYLKTRKYEIAYQNLSDSKKMMYVKKAADEAFKAGRFPKETTIDDVRRLYMYDDLDQGTGNSFTQYVDSVTKGKFNAKKYYENQIKAFRDYKKAVSDSIDDNFGDAKLLRIKAPGIDTTVENHLEFYSDRRLNNLNSPGVSEDYAPRNIHKR